MYRLISVLGIVVFIGLAWLMSSHKRRFPWRVVIGGLVLQFTFAALILLTDLGRAFFDGVDSRIQPANGLRRRRFAIRVRRAVFTEHPFAFRVLPSIIFFAALMQVLYYFGIMQRIVRAMGFVRAANARHDRAGKPGAAAQHFRRARRRRRWWCARTSSR